MNTSQPAASGRTSPPSGDVGGAPSSPQTWFAFAVLGALIALSWGLLLWEATRYGTGAQALWSAICRPVGLTGEGWPTTLGDLALAVGVWSAMAAAMMLPTAVLMLAAYSERAARAREQGREASSPLIVAAGYLSVWIGWSIVAIGVQAALVALWSAADIPPRMALVGAGTLVGSAGLYQFSELKAACLNACRYPIPDLFARWTGSAAGAFRLGVREGLNCLGCCWAMMGALVVIGAMNIVWMAIFSVLMALEKLTSGRAVSMGIGVFLIATGLALSLAGAGGDALVARLTARL